MMESLSQQNQKQMMDLSSQLQSGLHQFLTSMEEMFKKFSPTPPDSAATFSSVQAQHSQVNQTQQVSQLVPTPPEPMDTSFPHTTIKKGLKGVKGSASITPSTIKVIVSPPLPPTTQPQSESPLQRLEKGDYGVETGFSYSTASQIEDSELENLAPPPKADFHAFIDRVRQYLGIDDPSKTEDYKLGSGLGRDPNMFCMEQSSHPPSLKLLLMDDIAKLLQNHDTVVKPGPSSSTSLDIGQFLFNPPNIGNWYPVAGEKFNRGTHPFHLDILKQGYRLPFRDYPKLSRTPCIHSGYNEIDKDSALSTSILDLLAKNAIEEVNKQDSLGFYSRLFLVPKPGNRWRPVIDLSSLNQYLTVSKFKMETPESIRTSLRQGEWVTSIDPQSRKFLRLHHKETLYQFTSLPFGLATAPLVFTSLVKEVKLLALKQDICLHQYLDDWLIRASSQDEAQKHTVKLLSLIQNLGFIVNLRKSELNPQQRFDFIGYHFLLDQGLVRPTNERWNKIQISFNRISKKSVLSA